MNVIMFEKKFILLPRTHVNKSILWIVIASSHHIVLNHLGSVSLKNWSGSKSLNMCPHGNQQYVVDMKDSQVLNALVRWKVEGPLPLEVLVWSLVYRLFHGSPTHCLHVVTTVYLHKLDDVRWIHKVRLVELKSIILQLSTSSFLKSLCNCCLYL